MSSIPSSVIVLFIIMGAAALLVVGYVIHRLVSPSFFEETGPNMAYLDEQKRYFRDVSNRYWNQVALDHQRIWHGVGMNPPGQSEWTERNAAITEEEEARRAAEAAARNADRK
jgi:hypothetical protein